MDRSQLFILSPTLHAESGGWATVGCTSSQRCEKCDLIFPFEFYINVFLFNVE